MWKQVGFWSLVFIVFPVTAVTLDTNVAILGVQNLLFGRHVASILPSSGHFVSLGTTWGTMGAAGTTRWVLETDF